MKQGEVQPYRVWFDYLKTCLLDKNLNQKIDKNLYKSWDLKKIENAVDKLKLLSGYTFKRKDLNGIKDTGLLAQDVRSVLPEVVNENDEGILSIEYAKMMGLIVEAIKELNAKIDSIK